MSTSGSSGVGSVPGAGSLISAMRGPAGGLVSAVAGGEAGMGGARTSTDQGAGNLGMLGSAKLHETPIASAAVQSVPLAPAAEEAAADEAMTLPGMPLAQLLLQLRAVVRSQRAAGYVSKTMAASRQPGAGKTARQPVSKAAARGAADAYAKMQQLSRANAPLLDLVSEAE